MPRGSAARFRLGVFLLTAAVSLAFSQASIIRDYRGKEFRTGRAPQRIVSLAPNITEILFALGAGGQVTAVTRYCDYPPEAAEKTRIGGFLDPDIERIRDVSPDLIVAFRGNPLEKIERLDALGLPVFVLDIGYRLEDIPPLVENVGAVIGRPAEAAALARSLTERAGRVASALSNLPARPRVFLKLQGEGLWTCGRESYFTDLIEKAGGTSVTVRDRQELARIRSGEPHPRQSRPHRRPGSLGRGVRTNPELAEKPARPSGNGRRPRRPDRPPGRKRGQPLRAAPFRLARGPGPAASSRANSNSSRKSLQAAIFYGIFSYSLLEPMSVIQYSDR